MRYKLLSMAYLVALMLLISASVSTAATPVYGQGSTSGFYNYSGVPVFDNRTGFNGGMDYGTSGPGLMYSGPDYQGFYSANGGSTIGMSFNYYSSFGPNRTMVRTTGTGGFAYRQIYAQPYYQIASPYGSYPLVINYGYGADPYGGYLMPTGNPPVSQALPTDPHAREYGYGYSNQGYDNSPPDYSQPADNQAAYGAADNPSYSEASTASSGYSSQAQDSSQPAVSPQHTTTTPGYYAFPGGGRSFDDQGYYYNVPRGSHPAYSQPGYSSQGSGQPRYTIVPNANNGNASYHYGDAYGTSGPAAAHLSGVAPVSSQTTSYFTPTRTQRKENPGAELPGLYAAPAMSATRPQVSGKAFGQRFFDQLNLDTPAGLMTFSISDYTLFVQPQKGPGTAIDSGIDPYFGAFAAWVPNDGVILIFRDLGGLEAASYKPASGWQTSYLDKGVDFRFVSNVSLFGGVPHVAYTGTDGTLYVVAFHNDAWQAISGAAKPAQSSTVLPLGGRH